MGRAFLDRLRQASAFTRGLKERALDGESLERLQAAYHQGRQRLLLLDYDGTLAPFANRPEEARPSQEILDVLESLGSVTQNHVYLLSGRDRDSLGRWLGHLPVTLVAEHGAWVRAQGGRAWRATHQESAAWKTQFRPLLDDFVERVPGSLIEEKTLSLAWHYRKADITIASMAAKELVETLTNLTANTDLGVLQGNRVVEIKDECSTKGGYYKEQLAGRGWDFVLAIGDDWTDESLFRVLPDDAYSIKVGFGPSAAHHSLPSTEAVQALLYGLVGEGDDGEQSG